MGAEAGPEVVDGVSPAEVVDGIEIMAVVYDVPAAEEEVEGFATTVQAVALGATLLAARPVVATAAPMATTPPVATASMSVDQVLVQVVVLTNAERAAVGVAPLEGNPQLTLAAQRYADVMADTACFGHNCGPVPRLGDRAKAAGAARWGFIGENVAAGQPTPERVVAAWMASPTHRANLLNPEFTLLGVGQARGGVYGTYWTQEFGVPAAGTPVETPSP